MKKDMFRFLVSLLSVGAMLFILDRVGARVMWWVNQHTHDVSGPKIRMMTDSVDADFVMMGTSRCNSHYVPSILADSLRLTVYNGGVDASGCIFAHYFLLQQLLRHHSPKNGGARCPAQRLYGQSFQLQHHGLLCALHRSQQRSR